MAKLARFLESRTPAHQVQLFGYRSHIHLRDAAEDLANFLKERDLLSGGPELGFVVHSAGGVLLRYLAHAYPEFRAGRSVALGSPLSGSILAEHYAKRWYMRAVYGATMASLHPRAVSELPEPPCALASIAGTRQSSFVPASLFLRSLADGRVSDSTVLVEETKLPSLVAWTSVPVIHSLLPTDSGVHQQVGHYLDNECFRAT